MSLLVIYLLSSWLPTLISSTGRTLKDASLVTAMFQVGGTFGAIALGQLMDRFNPQRVLGIAYVLAALFIALIGSSTASTLMLVLRSSVPASVSRARRSASTPCLQAFTRRRPVPPA